MSRRLNQGRLYFLLNFVENSNHLNYYYVKKNRNLSCEYQMLDEELLKMEEDCFQCLQPMMERLLVTFEVESRVSQGRDIIATGECPTCLDYIWNGPFRDVCKHCHAARIFSKAQQEDHDKFSEETKYQLVTYFKNKERVLPADQKNKNIYFGSVEEAYNNIVELYMSQGNLLCHKIECPDSLLLVNFFLQGIGFFIPQFCSLPCVWILSVLQN